MAFNAARKPVAPQSGNEAWKSQAFLNLFINMPDGSKKKIGSIGLKESKKFEAALIARLQQEGAVDALKDALVLDFQMADDGKEIDNVGF